MLLILSDDINLNPGPVNRPQIKDHKFEVYQDRTTFHSP